GHAGGGAARVTAHATRPAEGKRAAALEAAGLAPRRPVHWNPGPPALYEHAVRRAEGVVVAGGAFCAVTTPHTGRSPNDKFIVEEPSSAGDVHWGRVNQPLEPGRFERLRAAVLEHLNGEELFVRDLFAGADANHRLGLRFVTPNAWHALFVYNMFLRPGPSELAAFSPSWLVLHAPEFQADPALHGTRSGTFIVIHFGCRTILIGGTRYAGELKKAVFSILNYLLPKRGVLSMHCSANLGETGDVALFFGLSGTGKTTLSADPERALIGDDEHGWSDGGVFNFEGGCYAKVIRLSPDGEPEIYRATQTFGTVLENVVVDPETREVDFESAAITENTRASYPIHYIPNHVPGGVAGHPSHIVFLTCDAYGVMPPIARLSPAQAMYHFLSGYTAKVAGTERGVTEPKATFSTCRCRSPASRTTCCSRGGRGATPPRTTPKRRASRTCSTRTSSSSRTTSTPPSGTQAPRVDPVRGRPRPALEQHTPRPGSARRRRHGRGAAAAVRAAAGARLSRLSRRHPQSLRARPRRLSPGASPARPGRRRGGRARRAGGPGAAQARGAVARHRALSVLARARGGGPAAPRGARRPAAGERRAGAATRGARRPRRAAAAAD